MCQKRLKSAVTTVLSTNCQQCVVNPVPSGISGFMMMKGTERKEPADSDAKTNVTAIPIHNIDKKQKKDILSVYGCLN